MANLPGANIDPSLSGTVLPGSQPQPHVSIPSSWQDQDRIIRLVLDIFKEAPQEAQSVETFAKEKLAAIRAGH